MSRLKIRINIEFARIEASLQIIKKNFNYTKIKIKARMLIADPKAKILQT